MSVVVVDTGVANLHSVTSALDRLDADWTVSSDLIAISAADRVILPGVGSAKAGMEALAREELVELLQSYDRPLLGICLGMQLLFHGLGESGGQGLGRLDGDIAKLDTDGQPLPHMGWNTLSGVSDDPLTDGLRNGDYVYFVHSYAAAPTGQALATSHYGESFIAIARENNVMGCQFHPERSGAVGARILENFLSL